MQKLESHSDDIKYCADRLLRRLRGARHKQARRVWYDALMLKDEVEALLERIESFRDDLKLERKQREG